MSAMEHLNLATDYQGKSAKALEAASQAAGNEDWEQCATLLRSAAYYTKESAVALEAGANTISLFTGPCRTWSDQAREIPTEDLLALMESYRVAFADLTPEDIEASLGAQKLESQP